MTTEPLSLTFRLMNHVMAAEMAKQADQLGVCAPVDERPLWEGIASALRETHERIRLIPEPQWTRRDTLVEVRVPPTKATVLRRASTRAEGAARVANVLWGGFGTGPAFVDVWLEIAASLRVLARSLQKKQPR